MFSTKSTIKIITVILPMLILFASCFYPVSAVRRSERDTSETSLLIPYVTPAEAERLNAAIVLPKNSQVDITSDVATASKDNAATESTPPITPTTTEKDLPQPASQSNILTPASESDMLLVTETVTALEDVSEKRIALTFDDGPNGARTTKLLELLDKYDAEATFFLVGERIELYPKQLKEIISHGNEIGNHTYGHRNLQKLSEADVEREITKTNDLVYKLTDTMPTLLRPPYGAISRDIKELFGMQIALWNLDPRDWQNHDAEKVSDYILSRCKDESVVVLHDSNKTTIEAVEIILEALSKKGYKFVTMSELISE